jgi:Killing trait
MADVTPVNGQITDAITQANLTVLGDAPAQAAGLVYQTVAHSISLAMANAQHAQGSLAQIGNAATSAAVGVILAAARRATTENDEVPR